MSEIEDFLKARLDEDEQIAKRAAWDHPDWVYGRQTFTVASARSAEWSIAGRKANGSPINDVDGEHIARHDPARVLAEVATKRAIIAMCTPDPSNRYPTFDSGYESAWEEALLHLASAYSDHPDWQPEWAPAP